MGEELKVNTKIASKLTEKLSAWVYRTRCYGYIHHSDPNDKHRTVFSKWLVRREGIAHTTREEQVLSSDMLASAASEPQKLTNASQDYSEEDVQHESSCAVTTVKRPRTWQESW